MNRFILSLGGLLITVTLATAQAPSYSKDVRPFLVKYCVECHNAKTLKGTLNLDSYKAVMEGADAGPVVRPGKPDESKLVLLTEHKDKPTMPPAKAKFQPTKDEIKLLRAWVAAGAKDDGVEIKVELPVIKAKANGLPPVTGLALQGKLLVIARKYQFTDVFLSDDPPTVKHREAQALGEITSVVQGKVTYGEGKEKSRWPSIFVAFSKPGANGKVVVDTGIPGEGEHPTHEDAVLDVALDPEGRWLASSSYDTRVHLKEWKGTKVHILKDHSDAVYGLAFNPDGTLLASVSADRAMKVWDVEQGKLLYTLGEATDWLYTVAWSPDGRYLVSGGVDKSIRVYEPSRTGAKIRQSVFAHEGPVQKVLFSSDSKTLYSVGQDRVIKAWDVEKMVERKVYDKQPETVLCLALREDAGQIIVGRYDGIVQLIDMKTGKVAHEFGKATPPKKKAAQTTPTSFQGEATVTSVTGILDRAGAVNLHRVKMEKGQQLGIQISADAKSKLEPVLRLSDGAGRVLADSADGRLGHTFADAGVYTISVHDRDYRGGPDFKYQLRYGEISIVAAVFPMGVQRGTTAKIRIDGVFLPKNEVTINVPKDAAIGSKISLNLGTTVLGKQEIIVGDWPEVVAQTIVPIPGTANGALVKDNQQDVWTFDAKKGQPLVVEVNARRIGSRLDSIIEILDASDRPVPRAVLRSQAKTHVTFRDHDSAQGNIRIETWSELSTNDLLYVGNDLMKIQALPTHPDADCNFFATGGQRIGFLDTTPTHHANGTPMYKVSVHPPGTTFPPNGYPLFTLFYRNDDGGPGYGRDSRILFDPPTDGRYKVRIADTRGMGGVNFGYRLTIRPPQPSFKLRVTPAAPVVSNFNAVPLTVAIDRLDGYDGPVQVRFENLPPGVTVPETTIEAGTFSTAVALHAQVFAPTAPPKLAMKAIGEAMVAGQKVTAESEAIAPKVIGEGDIRTWTDVDEVTIKPGQQSKLLVHIERAKDFTGRVPLDVRGLPHGVRVLDIGLNGILVNENETSRVVTIYAEPWVQAQDHPFVVLARREGKNTEHAAKSVLLKVK